MHTVVRERWLCLGVSKHVVPKITVKLLPVESDQNLLDNFAKFEEILSRFIVHITFTSMGHNWMDNQCNLITAKSNQFITDSKTGSGENKQILCLFLQIYRIYLQDTTGNNMRCHIF